MSITTSSDTSETCATGSMAACLCRYWGNPGAKQIRVDIVFHGCPCDRYASLQTQTDKFITRFVIVFASAIALLADHQTASQIIFFCHRCKCLSVHVDT